MEDFLEYLAIRTERWLPLGKHWEVFQCLLKVRPPPLEVSLQLLRRLRTLPTLIDGLDEPIRAVMIGVYPLELGEGGAIGRFRQLVDQVRHDPRQTELFCDCARLKQQPRCLKVVLGQAQNAKLRLLQFHPYPLHPILSGNDMVGNEDLNSLLKDVLQ